jgi:glycogen debranching enzyme
VTSSLVPALNDLAVSVAAPGLLLADPDGQVRVGGVSGWFVDDVRLLDGVVLSVDGSDLELVRSAVLGADRQEFTYVARRLGGWLHDPTVTVDRRRTLVADRLVEEIEVSSRGRQPLELTLHVDLVADLAAMSVVRQGERSEAVPGEETTSGLAWRAETGGFAAAFEPAPSSVAAGRVTWIATVEPGSSQRVSLTFTADGAPAFGPGGTPPWSRETAVDAPDPRLSRLVAQSVADLGGLLMRDGDDAFLAAGSPWFLTLFGRDSLWAARLTMPYGTGLALSTLRTLARRQGERDDPETEEQPGKILHEVRNGTLELGDLTLPPVYYGTVDATPLFVCTLADAWRWGADADQVRALLPATRRCLEWMMRQSEESGWLRYVDETGHGLANQGWKDSVDSVQFADGRLAEPPIALCEVQGYAVEAAVHGAALLAAFGEAPVEGLAAWADDLRDRFRRDFWVETPEGGHVAIALDAAGRRVDSVTSNMGHLLGTGILTPGQVDRVVEVLSGPDMSSGFGLRTLTSTSPRYSRLSYHGGTVWPHDTAVAVRGMALEGRFEEAASLTAGLVAAAEGVGYRLPELYGGDSASDVPFPVDYPASCRPQAWAAAAPLACLAAVSGVRVGADGPPGHPERTSTRLGPFTLHGLRVGDEPFTVTVAADGTVTTA